VLCNFVEVHQALLQDPSPSIVEIRRRAQPRGDATRNVGVEHHHVYARDLLSSQLWRKRALEVPFPLLGHRPPILVEHATIMSDEPPQLPLMVKRGTADVSESAESPAYERDSYSDAK
jgi:hypothetical protein